MSRNSRVNRDIIDVRWRRDGEGGARVRVASESLMPGSAVEDR